ncbi:MAG: recombination protein O N-terminal domain-containing protein [Candidatus Gracilibacteria bacterium]|nr:recombination protein O N-terminal domain-containing protein [Candidatus Gracilibacteria bacterium]
MFTTEAILLKKIPIRDGEELHELFTRDFGKIRAWVKKKKQIASVDHGSVIQCVISTKGSRNTLEQSSVKHTIRTEELDYISILCSLLCVQSISLFCPAGSPHGQIYTDYVTLLPFFSNKESSEKAKELFVMKLLKIHGAGWKRNETKESIIFRKIYKNIDSYSIQAFVKLRELNSEILAEIRGINQICMSQYI